MSVQSCVDQLAIRLQRPLGVDDRQLRAVAYSSHRAHVDPVRMASILQREAPPAVRDWLYDLGIARAHEPMRIPSNDELEMAARVCVPLRFQTTLHGYLWLIDQPEPLDGSQLEQVEGEVQELASELFRLRRLEDVDRLRVSNHVSQLLDGLRPAADEAADALLAEYLERGAHYAAVVVRPASDHGGVDAVRREAMAEELRRAVAPRRVVTVLREGELIGITAAASMSELEHGIERVRMACRDAVVAVGGPRGSLVEVSESLREARRAAWVAVGLGASGQLLSWARLGANGTIAALVDGSSAAEAIPSALEQIARSKDGELLLITLESYLEHAGEAGETARALHIHRSSLYHRLHRIEEASGLDLQSGDARLQLHLGIRLRHLTHGVQEPSLTVMAETAQRLAS